MQTALKHARAGVGISTSRPIASRPGCPIVRVALQRSAGNASTAVVPHGLGRIGGPAIAPVSSRGRRQVVKTQAFFKTIFRQDPSENTRKKYQPLVDRINALEGEVQRMTDDQLRGKTVEFRQRVRNGESLESLLPEAFAVSAMHASMQ